MYGILPLMFVNPITRLEQLVCRLGSQRAAAAALHVGPSYLSDLLRGRRDCSDAILKKLRLKRVVIAR
jgi:plasmid maintenance system antidote protein VapI|tara:strand:- start:2018 stop:2221 length:204 start_codon:yes stop_codon:yes gene_type:complete